MGWKNGLRSTRWSVRGSCTGRNPFRQKISFYMTSWRAYMDTLARIPSLLESSGIATSASSTRREADAVAELLSEAGIRSARVEIGWGKLSIRDDPAKMPEGTAKRYTAVLSALKEEKYSPANTAQWYDSGAPCPLKSISARLTRSSFNRRSQHRNGSGGCR